MSNIAEISGLIEEYGAEYDALFEETLSEIELDGQVLQTALKKQVTLLVKWELMSKKMDFAYNQCELLSEEAYAKAFKEAMFDRHRDVQTTQAKEIARSDKDYIDARKLLNVLRNMRDECRGILETVNSRKYILNNIVAALTHGVDHTIL